MKGLGDEVGKVVVAWNTEKLQRRHCRSFKQVSENILFEFQKKIQCYNLQSR